MKIGGKSFKIDHITFFWALLSGALIFLSFPKYGTGLCAWAALVPLLYTLHKKTLWQGFLTGFIAGFSANIGLFYWIAYVVVNYGYLPIPVGIGVMLLLSAYLAVYMGLFASGLIYFDGKGISRLFAAPLLWTCLEYAKSHLLTGFPWENLGHSQYLYQNVIQLSDITGVFGLSYVIVLVNVILFELVTGLHGSIERRPSMKGMLIKASAGVAIIAALVTYGFLRSNEVDAWLKNATRMPVSLIQGNIDQNIKWHPAFQEETITIYKTLTRRAVPERAGLIVWPETAAPFFFQDQDERHREVVSLVRDTDHWLLLGSPSYQDDGRNRAFLNSAFLVSPGGGMAGRYDKVHLVPYGEYVPLRRFFPFINKLVAGIGDFRRGGGYEPLIMQTGETSRKLGTLICYEGILPEAGKAYRQRGASLLVNITNDAWFGNTSAPYQHLSMTVFRSVESRLYLVRAANTGISAIIDPTGRILERTALFEKAVLQGHIRFMDHNTFYSTYGDVFVYGCAISLILLWVVAQNKGRGKYA